MPGIRPDDRRTVTDNVAAPSTPRNSAVRGTMGKPQLPRRRAQEHIAPQLRGGPAAPRPESDDVVEHDPGLMAAFQRGIGLAEARQLEADYTDPAIAAMEREYEARYGERARAQAASGQPAPSEPTYPKPAYPTASETAHQEPRSMERISTRPPGPGLSPVAPDGARTDPAAYPTAPRDHRDSPDSRAVPPGDTSPIPEAHRLRAPGHDLDLTARHDGSAPAG